jgi:hypothetical protein
MAADAKAAVLPWKVSVEPRVELDSFVDNRHGFLRVTATAARLTVEAFTR